MSAVEFTVLGTPAPKGSNRAMVRGGRAVFVPGGSRINQERISNWAHCVRGMAQTFATGQTRPLFTQVPVAVAIVFRIARPAGHWAKASSGLRKSAPLAPAVKPDIDKLARCTLDALSGVVFDDDSRITRLLLSKEYAKPGHEGATIRVWEDKQ